MAETAEVLELLRFELKFLEDGGYGRSPRTPWRASRIFEDSPTCPNFDDASRPHACAECGLMQFIPDSHRGEDTPCRLIPLTGDLKTIKRSPHGVLTIKLFK